MKKPIVTDFCETIYRADAWKYTQALEKYVEHLEQQLKNCNLQSVSNNEVAVCERCKHYRKDNTPDICIRCFSNSHFSKAN